MKLTVLVDNATIIDRYFLAEPAVSYLLEDGGARILLDTGYSDVFLKNARAMGIDLSRVTDIVLSHGHNDHTGGLAAYFAAFPQTRVRLTACPGVFAPRRDDAGLSIGSPLTQEAACARADVRLSDEPVRLSEHVTFLGRIPRRTDFEARTPIGVRLGSGGQWTGDLLPDCFCCSAARTAACATLFCRHRRCFRACRCGGCSAGCTSCAGTRRRKRPSNF